MIQAYALRSGRIRRAEVDKATPLAGDSLWLDLVRPDAGERGQVEAVLWADAADPGGGARRSSRPTGSTAKAGALHDARPSWSMPTRRCRSARASPSS